MANSKSDTHKAIKRLFYEAHFKNDISEYISVLSDVAHRLSDISKNLSVFFFYKTHHQEQFL